MICVKVRISLLRMNPSDFPTSELRLRVHIVSISIELTQFMPSNLDFTPWQLVGNYIWNEMLGKSPLSKIEKVDISKWRYSEEVTRVLGRSRQSARKKSLRKRHSESCLSQTSLTITCIKKKNRVRWILWILLISSLQRSFRSTISRADILCQRSKKNILCLKMKLFYLLEKFNQFPTFFTSNDYFLQYFPLRCKFNLNHFVWNNSLVNLDL